jgi:hypothetical protein
MLVFTLIIGAVLGATPLLVGICASLVAGSLGRGGGAHHIVSNTFGFMLGFIVTVVALGISFWALLHTLGAPAALYIAALVAIGSIAGGVTAIKQYFWPDKDIAHRPHKHIVGAIHTKTTKHIGFIDSLSLGMISVVGAYVSVGLSTLLVSCIVYIGKVSAPTAWLSAYAFALLFAVLCVAVVTVFGTKISAITKWRVDSTPLMHLGSGLTLIIASWVLLLMINTTVHVVAL